MSKAMHSPLNPSFIAQPETRETNLFTNEGLLSSFNSWPITMESPDE